MSKKTRFQSSTSEFGIAIFPCLKTSAPICIGGYIFRSTTDLSGLSDKQATAVCEIAAMLYARDDVQIAKAVYAITEPLGIRRPGPIISKLERVRAVVGYIYSSPHQIYGDSFMPFEFSSLAVVQPKEVSSLIFRPKNGTTLPPLPPNFLINDFGDTFGYEGFINQRPLWLIKGSRLYGGYPDTILNISQDLYSDVDCFTHMHLSNGKILLALLDEQPSPFQNRIFKAIDWYNDATEQYNKPAKKLLSLAIAFEVLLELPSGEKTDRLADSIALLLGRTVRLKDWAFQFYKARSKVAHEGHVDDWRFYSAQKGAQSHISGSIMSYGLEIFRICLAMILTGEWLARESGLARRFVSNSERYAQIAEILSRTTRSADESITAIESLVDELSIYRFAPNQLPIKVVLSALQGAAKALSQCNLQMNEKFSSALNALCDAPKKDNFTTLTALKSLEQQIRNADQVDLGSAGLIVAKLVKLGWAQLNHTYYRLKNHNEKKTF